MENFEIIFAFSVALAFILLFARLALRIRKTGGSMTTIMHGALDAFYNKDKKKAAEIVVEQKARKKTENHFSGQKK